MHVLTSRDLTCLRGHTPYERGLMSKTWRPRRDFGGTVAPPQAPSVATCLHIDINQIISHLSKAQNDVAQRQHKRDNCQLLKYVESCALENTNS